MRRDVRQWYRPLSRRGYRLQRLRSGHYALRSPWGDYVTTVPATPSDYRSLKNATANVRRYERQNPNQDKESA